MHIEFIFVTKNGFFTSCWQFDYLSSPNHGEQNEIELKEFENCTAQSRVNVKMFYRSRKLENERIFFPENGDRWETTANSCLTFGISLHKMKHVSPPSFSECIVRGYVSGQDATKFLQSILRTLLGKFVKIRKKYVFAIRSQMCRVHHCFAGNWTLLDCPTFNIARHSSIFWNIKHCPRLHIIVERC